MKSQEFSRRALSLSLAVYRVTASFPMGEVLSYQLRLLANQIVGDIVVGDLTKIEKRINRLLVYFKITSQQNWVRAANWTVLNFEYIKLKQEIDLLSKINREEEAIAAEEKAVENISLTSHNIKKEEKITKDPLLKIMGLSSRQELILEEINKRQFTKNSDLTPLFKNISKRTLRNDLKFLLEKKLIKKEGFNKTAVYLGR